MTHDIAGEYVYGGVGNVLSDHAAVALDGAPHHPRPRPAAGLVQRVYPDAIGRVEVRLVGLDLAAQHGSLDLAHLRANELHHPVRGLVGDADGAL